MNLNSCEFWIDLQWGFMKPSNADLPLNSACTWGIQWGVLCTKPVAHCFALVENGVSLKPSTLTPIVTWTMAIIKSFNKALMEYTWHTWNTIEYTCEVHIFTQSLSTKSVPQLASNPRFGHGDALLLHGLSHITSVYHLSHWHFTLTFLSLLSLTFTSPFSLSFDSKGERRRSKVKRAKSRQGETQNIFLWEFSPNVSA